MGVRLFLVTTAAVLLCASGCGKPFGDASPAAPPAGGAAGAPADAGDAGDAGSAVVPFRCTEGQFGNAVPVDELRLTGEELGMWLTVDQVHAYVAGRSSLVGDAEILLWTRSAPDRPFEKGPERPVPLQSINDAEQTTRIAFTSDERTVVVQYETGSGRFLRTAKRSLPTDEFPKPTNIVFVTVAGETEASGVGEEPFIERDGKALFFVRRDDNGDRRVYVAAARDADSWGRPIILDLGNTKGFDDASPVVSHDGLTLFYAAARPNGTGLDIYVRDRANTNVMFEGPAQSLGTVINSAADDYPVAVSNDACTLFFVSRRGQGIAHLWKSQRSR